MPARRTAGGRCRGRASSRSLRPPPVLYRGAAERDPGEHGEARRRRPRPGVEHRRGDREIQREADRDAERELRERVAEAEQGHELHPRPEREEGQDDRRAQRPERAGEGARRRGERRGGDEGRRSQGPRGHGPLGLAGASPYTLASLLAYSARNAGERRSPGSTRRSEPRGPSPVRSTSAAWLRVSTRYAPPFCARM